MDYSKEELLTIGNFFEIPNVDQKKTARQLKIIIDKWLDKGIERTKQINAGKSLELSGIIMFNKEGETMQLTRENLHLSLDLKLEKLINFGLEKVKQQQQPLCDLDMLNHPNFGKLIVWWCKEIFYKPNFDAERFKLGIFVEFLRLF